MHVREGERGRGEGGVWRNFSGGGGMVQPSQQHVAPCVKGVQGRGEGERFENA